MKKKHRTENKPGITLSRRGFLRKSVAAGGLLASGPLLIPATALGRDGNTPPSERIRMGFIGQGGQGRGHLTGGAWTYIPGGYVARNDVQVMAVCDIRRGRREDAQRAVNAYYADKFGQSGYNGCAAYIDFRELLARDDIDAVLIACPLHWHAVMAIMAAEAGKDVYCEKPGTCTIQQGRALSDIFRRTGRVYQAGTQQRSEFAGKFRLACQIVRSGRLGDLKEVYAYRPGGMYAWPAGRGEVQPEPDDLDWDLFLGPAQWLPYDGNPGTFRFCTGDINWTPHHYDFVQWVLDADRSGPVEIAFQKCRTAAPGGHHGMPVYRYASGVVVYGGPYPGEPVGEIGGACFVGTKGRLAVDRENIVSYPASILKNPPGPHEAPLYRVSGHGDNFLDCIRTRQPAICDPETAHRAMTLVLLGGIVTQLKRPLQWDTLTERFAGDEEANRLRSLATRPPWHI